MHARRLPTTLAIALLVVTSAGFSASVSAVPRPDGCQRVVTTGRALSRYPRRLVQSLAPREREIGSPR